MMNKFGIVSSVLAAFLLCVVEGCGEYTPPSDEDMLRHLDDHESEFSEIVEILNRLPYDSIPDRYPPFNLANPEDSLFQAILSDMDGARLDSLLKRVNCECVRRYTYNYLDEREIDKVIKSVTCSSDNEVLHRGYSFQFYVDGYSVGSSIEKSLVYVLDGEYAAKSEKSKFSYNSGRNFGDSIFTVNTDTEKYRSIMHRASDIHAATIRRHLRDNWLILLCLD